jgi:hypothetical protein
MGEFKMVKKKPENTEARISKLPVELSDAPLVIDLPDGQKIILSKLQEGAVIEVATWHGTGRPDSRTNRFMLGMTTGQSTSGSESASVAPTKSEADPKKPFIGKMDIVLKSAKSLITNLSQPMKTALKKSKELTPVDSTTDLEINAWLDSLKSEATAISSSAPATKRATSVTKTVKKQAVAKKTRK